VGGGEGGGGDCAADVALCTVQNCFGNGGLLLCCVPCNLAAGVYQCINVMRQMEVMTVGIVALQALWVLRVHHADLKEWQPTTLNACWGVAVSSNREERLALQAPFMNHSSSSSELLPVITFSDRSKCTDPGICIPGDRAPTRHWHLQPAPGLVARISTHLPSM
jgi:hypothetical protein